MQQSSMNEETYNEACFQFDIMLKICDYRVFILVNLKGQIDSKKSSLCIPTEKIL